MKHLNVKAYLHFELDGSPIKRRGELVAAKWPRYMLTLFSGAWSGVEKLRNARGQVRLTKIANDTNKNRKADAPEYYLQAYAPAVNDSKGGSYNMTGLRFAYCNDLATLYASGEPYNGEYYPTKNGDNGIRNPLYEEAQAGDKYLFIKPVSGSPHEKWIDMLVVSATDIDAWRTGLAGGIYDEQLAQIRAVSNPFGQ